MTEFIDPENKDELINKIKTLPSVQDVINFTNELFPSWIVLYASEYSEDYSYFNNNWRVMITLLQQKLNNPNIKQEKIILVRDVGLEQNKKVINTIAEILTCSGFIVRNYTDFRRCEFCEKILPTNEFYDVIKKVNSKNVPSTYLSHCKDCK